MSHFDECNGAICVAEDVNEDETVWLSDEELCTGHPLNKSMMFMRRIQKGYQKRDKAKGIVRTFTFSQLMKAVERRVTRSDKQRGKRPNFASKAISS